MRFIHHADFDYYMIDDVIVVYDLDQGNCSVTNDVDHVLETLKNAIPDITSKKIVYRDSMGIFDEIVVDHLARFVAFRSINEKNLEKVFIKLHRSESII